MHCRHSPFIAVGLGIFLLATTAWAQLGGAGADPEAVPDKAASRRKIDDLIASFKKDKSRATLGMVQECMDRSIDFGAPTWNAGDHAACFAFYRDTAQALVTNFGDGAATPLAASALADLKTALARVKDSSDVDKNAWAMRYAFDKAQLACEGQYSQMAAMLSLGSDYLARQDIEDAADAFAQARALLPEMNGRDTAKLPALWRVAPMVMANLDVAQKKYKEAAGAISRGVEALPDWARTRTDLRRVMGGPEVVSAAVSDLKAAAAKDPKDAGAEFLLGYELNFNGQHDEARGHFQKALELDPSLKAAQIFLDAPAPPADPPPPIDPRRVG